MNRGFFMANRGRYFVQQSLGGAAPTPAPPFSFTDPTFGGTVYVIVDDGSGGKFVGGSWTSVTCNVTATTYTTGYTRLIHLLATGEVDAAWSCPAGSTVYDLALDETNGVLYAAGAFVNIGGTTIDYIAAISPVDGTVDAGWDSGCNNRVEAVRLDPTNDRIFLGGYFTLAGGAARNMLACLTISTATAVPAWVCDTGGTIPYVYGLFHDSASDALYVWGRFASLQGTSRVGLGKVVASTGALDAGWVCDAGGSSPQVFTCEGYGANLIVGGSFTTLGGVARVGLARVSASSGSVDAGWVCNLGGVAYAYQTAVNADTGVVFVVGNFTSFDGASRSHLAAADEPTGDVLASWVCNASAKIECCSLDVANDALFVGGIFNGATGLDGQQRDRFGTVVASTGDLFVP